MVGNFLYGEVIHMVQSTVISGDEIYIDGEKLPPLPKKRPINSVTQCGGRLYVNGYEWNRGKWRRTLRAVWNYWFRGGYSMGKDIVLLKSCQICGEKAAYICEPFADRCGYGVVCKRAGCLILPAVYSTVDEAAAKWNMTTEKR